MHATITTITSTGTIMLWVCHSLTFLLALLNSRHNAATINDRLVTPSLAARWSQPALLAQGLFTVACQSSFLPRDHQCIAYKQPTCIDCSMASHRTLLAHCALEQQTRMAQNRTLVKPFLRMQQKKLQVLKPFVGSAAFNILSHGRQYS